jgi:hypothetical protein
MQVRAVIMRARVAGDHSDGEGVVPSRIGWADVMASDGWLQATEISRFRRALAGHLCEMPFGILGCFGMASHREALQKAGPAENLPWCCD